VRKPAEILGAPHGPREQPELLPDFAHTQIPFSFIIGEGRVGVASEKALWASAFLRVCRRRREGCGQVLRFGRPRAFSGLWKPWLAEGVSFMKTTAWVQDVHRNAAGAHPSRRPQFVQSSVRCLLPRLGVQAKRFSWSVAHGSFSIHDQRLGVREDGGHCTKACCGHLSILKIRGPCDRCTTSPQTRSEDRLWGRDAEVARGANRSHVPLCLARPREKPGLIRC